MKTKQECALVLHKLGIASGDIVLIHHHEVLENLLGRSATMIEALVDAVGSEGTIVTYQIMHNNQDPSFDKKIAFNKREKVRQEMKEFDWKKYREVFMNSTLLALSKCQNAQFNHHPEVVVCAVGKYAQYMTRSQTLDFPFGPGSVFEAIKELGGKVLSFNESYENCHELRYGLSNPQIASAGIFGSALGGKWVKYLDYSYDVNKFVETIESVDKKECLSNKIKIECWDYTQALNQYIKKHPILFKELGQ